MKNLVFVLGAIAITSGAAAQVDSTYKKSNPHDMNHQNENLYDMNHQNENLQNNPDDSSYPDGVLMENGKMMRVEDGQMTIIQNNDMILSNGTKIMSDGTWVTKEGTKTILKEGQHLDMSGNMTTNSNKDKNMYLLPDSTLRDNK